eukprot:13419727-Alexandrium_andersonii.AAC.1
MAVLHSAGYKRGCPRRPLASRAQRSVKADPVRCWLCGRSRRRPNTPISYSGAPRRGAGMAAAIILPSPPLPGVSRGAVISDAQRRA